MKINKLPLVLVLFLMQFASVCDAQNVHRDTLTCPPNTDTIRIGPIFVGESIVDSLVFFNNNGHASDSSIAFSYLGDSSSFALIDFVSPVIIRVATARASGLRFSPSHAGLSSRRYQFRADSCGLDLVVLGDGVAATSQGATFDLQNPSLKDIAFKNHDTAVLNFYLRNNSAGPFTIDSIFVKNAVDFKVDTIFGSSPWTLPAGDSLPIRMRFFRSTVGVSVDSLIVMPSNPTISEIFRLVGERTDDAFVRPLPSHSQFSILYPNPTAGVATLHAPQLQHAQVRVLDLLGREIARARFVTDWTWAGTYGNGIKANPGTYFFEVTGILESGSEIEEVQRLVLKP